MYKKRYRRYKKRSYFRPQNSYRIAKNAFALAKKVSGMVNVEYKHKDETFSATVGNTWGSTNLTDIAEGDGSSGRDGDKIRLKSFLIEGNVRLHDSDDKCMVTLALVQWKRPNGQTIAKGNIFSNDYVYSLRETTKMQDYKILWRKSFALETGGNEYIKFKKYMKLNLPCKFDASTGAIATQVENSLYLFSVSTEATNEPTLSYQSRIRYIDN